MKINGWILDDWGSIFDIIIYWLINIKDDLGICPYWEQLWNNPLPDVLLPLVRFVDGVGRRCEEELDDGLHQLVF